MLIEKIRRLGVRPSEQDLHELAGTAKSQSGEKFACAWQGARKDHLLSVHYSSHPNGAFEWRMFSGTGSDLRLRWFHLTEDVSLIYGMMLDELGENRPKGVSAQDQMKTFTRLPQLTNDDVELALTSSQSSPKLQMDDDPEPIGFSSTFDNVPIYTAAASLDAQQHLNGNLALVNATTLMQSISLGQLSGRLRIRRQWATVDIYFENGRPVHAAGTHSTGDECFLQTICWRDGDFHFEPKSRTDEHTITQGINSLMLQGCQLLDNTDYLKRRGLTTSTVLVRTHAQMTEQEFEQALRKGAPLDMHLLKSVYLNVDGRSTMQEIIDKLGLERSQWVNLVATLIGCDVVGLASTPNQRKLLRIEPKEIDQAAVADVKKSLTNEKTNLFTYPALLFFLEQEIRLSSDRPVTLVLFDIGSSRKGGKQKELHLGTFMSLAMQIHDNFNEGILAHYESHSLALILPGTKSPTAAKHADVFLSSLLTNTLGPGLESSNLAIAIGIASCPDDCNSMVMLLSAAETAMKQSRSKSCAVTLAKDLDIAR